MFGVKGYCRLDLTVNFHPEHFIDPINCPWVSEDEMTYDLKFLRWQRASMHGGCLWGRY